MKGVFENNDLTIVARQIKGFWAFPPMFHAHMEIVYVISGSINMSIGGMHHTLMPGQMSICFPYLIHSYEESPDVEAVILLFSAAAAGAFEHKLRQVKPVNPYLEPSQETLSQLKQILAHNASGAPDSDMLTKAYLSTLVGELLLTIPTEPVNEMDLEIVQNLLKYCEEHYREDVSIASAAQTLHISESYVTKIFSSKLGCSFRKYINRLRLMEVKKLLRSSEKSIIDIMLSCGFNNQSSFNRIFFEEIGVTPREYRQQGRNR